MQLIITFFSIILLIYLGYQIFHHFTRPEPEILAFFDEILPEGKLNLNKAIVEKLIPFRNDCNQHNLSFDPTVLQLTLKNTGDVDLDELILYVTIDLVPRRELEHVKSDHEPCRIKKTIGEFQRFQHINIPLILTGFFKNMDVEFRLTGRRADSRFMNRINITDSKSFQYEETPSPEMKPEHPNNTGSEP